MGAKKKNPLKKIPKLQSRGWTEQIPAERCAAWWNLGVNTCPRCVTSPAVRLQCGSSCISHRLPKVPGAPPFTPPAVQRADKLFYVLQETRRFQACTQAHARTWATSCTPNVGHRVMDAVSDWSWLLKAWQPVKASVMSALPQLRMNHSWFFWGGHFRF